MTDTVNIAALTDVQCGNILDIVVKVWMQNRKLAISGWKLGTRLSAEKEPMLRPVRPTPTL